MHDGIWSISIGGGPGRSHHFSHSQKKEKVVGFVSDHLKRLTGLKYGDLNKSYKKSLKLIKFPQN